VVGDEPEMTMERLRGLAQAVIALPRAVFAGTTAEPPAVLFATSEDSGVDAGKVLRAELERAGGRGGGNPRIAQGSAPAAAIPQILLALFPDL